MGNEDAFFAAVMRGDLVAVTDLLNAQPSLSHAATSDSEETGLHLAASFGHLEIAKLLVARGAEINALTALEHTPRSAAFQRRRHDIEAWLESIGGVEYQ